MKEIIGLAACLLAAVLIITICTGCSTAPSCRLASVVATHQEIEICERPPHIFCRDHGNVIPCPDGL